MTLRDTPIRRKLTVIILLVSGVVSLLTCAALFTHEFLTFRQNTIHQLSTVGQIVAANSTAALAFDNRDDAKEVLSALKAEPHIIAASLYDQRGNLFAPYPANSPPGILPDSPQRDGYRFEGTSLVAFEPVVQGGKRLGTLYLQSDLRAIYERFRSYGVIVVLVMLLSFGAAYLLARTLGRQISRPVLALAGAAREVSERGDYSVRAARFGRDELGLLTDSFNQMLARIQSQNQTLRQNEAQLQTIIENLGEGLAVSNLEGRLLHFNRAALELHGFATLEECRRHLHEFAEIFELATLEGAVLPLDQWPLARILRGETLRDLEVNIRHRKGDWRKTFNYGGTLVRDADGRPMMAVVTISDITERRRSEAGNRELAAIVESSDDAIVGKDLRGIVTSWNSGAEHFFGYTKDEMVGTPLVRIIPPDRSDEEERILRAIARGESVRHFETVRLRKGGQSVEVSVSVSPIRDARGVVVGASKIVRDITERKLAEKKLLEFNVELERRVQERTAQLESANKELEAFSYSVSHDLRAPLRHIDGFAQLLGKHLEVNLDETSRRYLTTITDSAKRLGVLIDELLVFSRMGRTEMRRANVETRAVIDEVVRELQHETQGRRIEWNIEELPAVRVDPVMYRQIWSNLLGNALKYSRRREVARIEIRHHTEAADGLVFAIKDNGAGFQMEYAAKLFGVFQRLHNLSEFEGTGIGLANVRRIVERHGGRTWAEGRPDEGATFFFSLPAADVAPPQVNPSPL